eukprot:COSAG01_NODE_856_length_13082_cov_23.882009_11_plen_73_part_00
MRSPTSWVQDMSLGEHVPRVWLARSPPPPPPPPRYSRLPSRLSTFVLVARMAHIWTVAQCQHSRVGEGAEAS